MIASAAVGVPPVTSYVESAAGVAAGGRTGLTAVTVGAIALSGQAFAQDKGAVGIAMPTQSSLRSTQKRG